MKKYILFGLFCIFGTISISAQSVRNNVKSTKPSVDKEKADKNKQKNLFGHWSLELNAGTNKPVEPFAEGYYASEPNKFSNFGTVNHFGLGLRYMPSNIFGLKSMIGYDKIKNSSNSKEFELSLYTFTLEGVLNMGRLARFETFTNRLNFLAHFGVQTTYKTVDSRLGVEEGSAKKEQDGGIVIGLTPEFKISRRLTLFADFSSFTNFRQHIKWDGSKNFDRNLNGSIYNTTIGVILNFAEKGKEHADWYVEPKLESDNDALKRLQEVESLVADVDRDGVPDYRDLQNNTPNGVAVDTKGRFFDINKNGIADELEKTSPSNVNVGIDNSKTGVVNSNPIAGVNSKTNYSDSDVTRALIEKGYFNIFFDISKDYPNNGSTQNVYHIIHYLKQNPDTKVRLIGHTDKTGDMEANKSLSERRAKSIFNLISASGIDESRIKIEGLGIDNDVPSDVKAGNNMARRVSVVIEK